MFSNIFWVAMAIPAAILIGGFIIWATRKPVTKPNLATRWNETEAQILEEYGDGIPNSQEHKLVEDEQRRVRTLEETTGEKEGD
ncbi:MAG: hypothetical protein KGZ96_10600 [Clostridia bacterium]|nr:hypothetical protein [Clostridia bacterium]